MFEADEGLRRRQRHERIWRTILGGTALLSLAILATLLIRMALDGLPHMDIDFWTKTYSRLALSGLSNDGSGILDALVTSLVVLILTLVIAIPIGTGAGIYLYEYAPNNRLTAWIRTTVNNLAGVPSVVYGLLGLAVFVRGFSTWFDLPRSATNLASALTLAVLILPILITATEEALKTVPDSVRQASLGLGATKWQTIRHHVVPYAIPGILTGQILALSRAAGETAPLLIIGIPTFTSTLAFGPLDVGAPLQVRAYYLSQDAKETATNMAAASIVVLLMATFMLNMAAILLRDRLQKRIKW